MYIVTLSFLKINTNLHVADTKGNTKLFFNSCSANLVGKQKKNRTKAVTRLISLMFKKANFLREKPIALHLNNVGSHKSFIIYKFKQSFFIRIIKNFTLIPHNGCRKKKIRRKKITRNFK